MPLNIPSSIVPGDTLTWRDRSLRGKDPTTGNDTTYNASNYALSWAIRGAIAVDAVAVADGQDYVTTIPAEATASLVPGAYFWQAFITNEAGDRLTIGSGRLTVVANLSANTLDYDGRTSAEKMLEAVEAALAGTSKGIQSYTIKGRSLSRYSMAELVILRNQLKVEVSRIKAPESMAQGLGDPRRMFVRWV